MHAIQDRNDIDRIFAPGGAIEAFEAARKAGKCRFIGFTGHHDSQRARGHAEGLPYTADEMAELRHRGVTAGPGGLQGPAVEYWKIGGVWK